ncbi:DoxX family protein [Spirillospora sp. CA-255316]
MERYLLPLPELSAWFGASMQLIGGVVVVFGALNRLMSAGFAVVMADALIFVHPGESLVMSQDGSGSGFAFIMLAASIALQGTGAGRISVDGAFADWKERSGRTASLGQTSGV